MNIERLFCEIDDYIQCEHKNLDYGTSTPFHSHDGYELLLLLDGDINYYTEAEGLHLKYGNLVCIRPYDFHRREVLNGENYKRIVIHVRKSVLERLSSDKTDVTECFYRVPAGKINVLKLDEYEIIEYSMLAKRLSQELSSSEYGSDILAETYLKQILVMVNSHSKKSRKVRVNNIMPPLVADTISFIDRNITERFSLDDIADHLNYNGTYISRYFKRITGVTIQQYIINKRISLAKKYLNEGLPPCDACFMSGFNDYSNFSRTFTKFVGRSPIKYQSS
ncbi:MAG: AraC family transcriptional regulator [Clostridiales bacterium]|nr:AraC family transcriptional regulator [Clostridiales bacterium]